MTEQSVLQRAKANLPRMERRAALRRAIRFYLDQLGFLEVETPVRIPAPAPEEFIETIPANGAFLRPSPELEMKILLGAGYKQIYQFGSCFRAGEHGRKHREEFTMLEYYQLGIDYHALAELTAGFIRYAAEQIFGKPELCYQGRLLDLKAPFEWITVEQAFLKYTNSTMDQAILDDSFDELMVLKIEPELGKGQMTFLADYPVERAALARVKPGQNKVSERWELYIDGMELANAYSELIDGTEQRKRFTAALEFRAANHMQPYPEAKDFLKMMDQNLLPECAGSALGFDRLAMLFCDAEEIGDVRF